MKATAKTQTIFLIAALVILTAVFLFAFNSGVVSAADFELVYPTDGYIQLENADSVAISDGYTAALDCENGKVLADGDKTLNFAVGSGSTGVYLASTTMLMSYSDGTFKAADLSAATPALATVTFPSMSKVSYVTADGGKFYAHDDGTVRVYDADFTLLNTYTDSVFAGKPVLVANGGKIYLYNVEYGVKKYAVYDEATGNSQKSNSEISAASAAIGDVIYVHNTTSVVAVSKTDGSVLFDTEITSKNFSACSDKLLVANGADGYSLYSLDLSNNKIDLSAEYSMKGESLNRLNNPSDVTFSGGQTVVADTDKDRVLFFGESTYAVTVAKPIALAAGKNRLYAASSSTLYVIENKQISAQYTAVNIIDVAYLDKLYVLTGNGLYTLLGGSLEKLCDLDGGVAVSTADDGAYLYVLTSDGLNIYDKSGNTVFDGIAVTDGVDCTVDYCSNVYVLKSDGKVYKYSVNENVTATYTSAPTPTPDVITFENALYDGTANSVTLDGKDLYFTANECLLGKADVSASTKTDFTSTALPDVSASQLNAYSLSSATAAYAEPKRFDTALIIPANAKLLVYDVQSGVNGFYYAIYEGKTLFVLDNGADTALTPTSVSKQYVTVNETKLYTYPDSENFTTLERGKVITIADDASNIDGGKWFRTVSDGKYYYVLRSDVEEYVQTEDGGNTAKTVYGKAKASRAGGTVNVYYSADTSSSVVVSVTDGTEFVILETLDGYYKVKCGDYVGYVLSEHVLLDGLTTVQIVAIVLSVIVIVAGTAIFLLTKRLKKKAENEE